MVRIRRALISVSDKRELGKLGSALARHGVEVLSTGGTARLLREAGIAVTDVAAHTGAPEILDGRVKTLHPKIHGGLLGRPTDDHRAQMAQHGIAPIDLVVVNLYPFAETIARPGVTLGEAIENIDIGGPSMIRSGAKNHERVTVVVDPDDYGELVAELDAHDGSVSRATRFRLARKAFVHTAGYDGMIANYLTALPLEAGETQGDAWPAPFPEVLTMQWVEGRTLRYGENPHQQAAVYLNPRVLGPSVARAEVLQGKELSYNNYVDLDAALELVCEFAKPAAVVVKHTNPCGAAESDTLAVAYLRARAADPTSAFGGVVALNRPVDDELAKSLAETFLECVIAPGFKEGARAELGKKKNLRLLAYSTATGDRMGMGIALRSIQGGLLVQTSDAELRAAADADLVTQRRPAEAELRDLDFAWRVAKHVKSNAIVLTHDGATVGVGAGQMSRVDSVKIAVEKAGDGARGAVLASDAFFPFRDGVDAAARAGVTAIIQPGGSVRDEEVIAAANEQGLAMLFTRMRHFKH